MAEDNDTVEVEETEVPELDEDARLVDEEEMTPEDSLAVLLSANPVHQTAKVKLKERKGMGALVLTLRSLTDREFKSLRKQATIPARGKKGEEFDDSLFTRLIVATAVHEPNLKNQELMKHHGVNTLDALVGKIFLPGQVARISEKVMALSGWDEESVEELGES